MLCIGQIVHAADCDTSEGTEIQIAWAVIERVGNLLSIVLANEHVN